jgi:hypothetical protein
MIPTVAAPGGNNERGQETNGNVRQLSHLEQLARGKVKLP